MKTILKLSFLLFAVIISGKARSQCNDSVIANLVGFGEISYADYPVSFDSGTTPSVTWNFGDGTSVTDSSYYQYYNSHQYTASGTYELCATDNSTGCTACDSVTIDICAGNISFSAGVNGFGLIGFNAEPLGMPGATNASWSFGDGGTSTLLNPTYQYAASGNYNVTLTLTNPNISGCTNTVTQQLQVQLCQYSTTWYDSVNPTSAAGPFIVPNPVAGYQYIWNFGDGTSGTGDTLEHQYAANGVYDVCLTIADSVTGCRDTQCQELYFDHCNIDPTINAGVSGLTVNYGVTFQNDSAGGFSFAWSFPGGNPSSGSGQTETVGYAAPGVVTATVIITVDGTCNDTLTYSTSVAFPTYTISGQEFEGVTTPCATTYLIQQDSGQYLVLVDSVIANDSMGCSGYYTFNSLQADTFYVKAALDTNDPNYSNYLPTYFGNVLNWADATAIIAATVSGSNTIEMIAGTNPGGPGFIGGYVSQGAGILAQGGGQQVIRGMNGVGDPLSGIQINLLTADKTPVTYTYTNSSGQFIFKNLAVGSYQVYAEVINRVPTPIMVDITQDNLVDTSLHISVNSNSAAAGINNLDNITVNGIYPNPTATTFTLQIGSTQNVNATLKLTDVLGRVVQVQQFELTNGNNTTEMNIEQLPSGVYELVIQTATGHVTIPVVKAK